MNLNNNQREADEQRVIALVEQIETDLLSVLDRHTATADADQPPRFARHLAMHATADLLGRLMLSAVAVEGEAARRSCQQLVDALQMFIAAPMTMRPQ